MADETDDGPLSIEIVEEAGDWDAAAARRDVAAVVRALRGHLPEAAGTATVALADDATVRDLNRRFRGKDASTNVLSFPSGEAPGREAHLGDVVLARETLAREAEVDGKPIDHHFIHLVVHGMLHLMGYDHESDRDAEAMEGLETAILVGIGVPDPYAEPATTAGA